MTCSLKWSMTCSRTRRWFVTCFRQWSMTWFMTCSRKWSIGVLEGVVYGVLYE